MRMIITNIECHKKCTYVLGNINIGSIKGKWCCKEPPILGEVYFCELSIEKFDRNEISISCDAQVSSNVCVIDDYVQFKGVCEEIDDIYVIRLDTDWIEMISVDNDDFSIRKGDKISFSLHYDCIGIYPY